MTTEYKTSGTFKKSARIVSDYKNDLVFEQPRNGLIEQRLITLENLPSGMVKRTIKDANCFSINSITDIKNLINEFKK